MKRPTLRLQNKGSLDQYTVYFRLFRSYLLLVYVAQKGQDLKTNGVGVSNNNNEGSFNNKLGASEEDAETANYLVASRHKVPKQRSNAKYQL